MNLFDILAILLTLSAVFSYVNYRYLKLPTTIGLMLIALLMSLGLVLLEWLGAGIGDPVRRMLASIDFNKTLLEGMLSFLLFAGALHVNLADLAKQKWVILLLATAGVLLSTFVIGYASWLLLGWLGIEISLMYCLLFGALISPTDPIAVLAILKTLNVPKSLETKIAGESLFNDGIGVVVFLVMFGLATGSGEASVSAVSTLFVQEVLGGIVFGLLIGYLAFLMLRSIDNYQVEVLITLALVTGGYAFAHAVHISGPITVVVAGLLIGNHGRVLAMSEKTRDHLDTFWELMDEILNAVLFVLIGLEVLVLTVSGVNILAGLLMIPVALLARLLAVGGPITLMRRVRVFSPGAVRVLTWGGLRGGISVALALSLPAGPERDVILMMTYLVVVFSVLVQGLTVKPLLNRVTLGR